MWVLAGVVIILPILGAIGGGAVAGYMALNTDNEPDTIKMAKDTAYNVNTATMQVPEMEMVSEAVVKRDDVKRVDEEINKLTEKLVRAFVQNPNYIDMKSLGVKVTDGDLLIEFYNAPNRRLFEEGEAEITEYGQLIFKIVAQTLAKHNSGKSTFIEIEGHTSKDFKSLKEGQDGKAVSTARARNIRDFMSEQGVKSLHALVAGYGNSQPLKDKHDDRVSILIRGGYSE